MKVLLLSQARQISDQPDYNASFGKVAEVVNIPFVGYVEKYGGEAFYREVVRANKEFKPDLVFFQFFHSGNPGDPTICVNELHASANKPLVFGSSGDPFDTGLLKVLGRPIERYTLQLAAVTDAFFTTSMGNVADEFVKCGARNVIFLPHAFCPMHFPNWESVYAGAKEYKVAMLCSNGRLLSRRPLRTITNTWKRRSVVRKLSDHFGSTFSVFGRGWNGVSAAGTIPFGNQLDIYKRCRVLVDAPAPILHTTYYASDRPFFMLATGVPMVFFKTPRFENILRPNEHVFYAEGVGDVSSVCNRVLSMDADELEEMGRNNVKLVKSRHMIDHRIDTILSVASVLKKKRNKQLNPAVALKSIRMWHFLPDVDLNEECKYAIANWVG